MTELIHDDPCIIFALRREAGAFCREFRPQQHFPGAPCRARFCGPEWLTVLVIETGVGAAAVESALEWLLRTPTLGKVPYRPKVVISAGFSGALRHDLAIGTVILGTEVVDLSGQCWPISWPGTLPPGEWRPPLLPGRLLCVDRFIGAPEEKAGLSRTHEALALDMESAVIARLCSQRAIPFGCVRVISDDFHTPLSKEVFALVEEERVSPVRLLTALCRRPRLGGELWRLARQTRRAALQLQQALGELLTLTLPFGREL